MITEANVYYGFIIQAPESEILRTYDVHAVRVFNRDKVCW